MSKPDVKKMKSKKDIEGLIKALKDKDEDVGTNAAEALGEIGDARAVEPLIQALKDEHEDVRGEAADALGEIGDARAVEPLIQALKDEHEDVRGEAADALDKLHWRPSDDSEKTLYLLAKQEWDALVELGQLAVEPLIQALEDEDELNIGKNAIEALGEIGDARAVEPLTQLLHENSSFVSAKSVRDTVEVALARISRGREAVKKGECPICGTNLEFWEGLKTKCSGCKVNLIVEKQQLVAETSVAKSPIYEVGISRSPQTELLQAARMGANLFPFTPLSDVLPSVNWPQCCCICLEPVGPFDFYEIRKKEVYENVPTSDEYVVQEVKLKIPYCKNCRHKVKKLFGGESQGASIEVHFDGITLKFRNPLYVKMFRQANKQLYYRNI